MAKIVLLVLVSIALTVSTQQLFESKILTHKDRKITGPTLYLSRENPMYTKSKTSATKQTKDDLSDFYAKYILGLDARPNINKEETEINENNNKQNIHSSRTSFEEKTPPDGQYIINKNAPFVLENGTLSLGGHQINDDDFKKKLSNISSYTVKNIKIQETEPIVAKISTIKFNGESVAPEFIRKYFSDTLKIFGTDLEGASTKNIETKNINRDGFGLIDVRSGFLDE